MKRNIAYMDPKDNAFIIFYLFQVLFRSSCSSINYQRMFLLRYPFRKALKHPTKKTNHLRTFRMFFTTTHLNHPNDPRLTLQGLQTQPNWLAIRWTWVSTPQGVIWRTQNATRRRETQGPNVFRTLELEVHIIEHPPTNGEFTPLISDLK